MLTQGAEEENGACPVSSTNWKAAALNRGPGSGQDHKHRANLGEARAQAGHEADKDSESVSVHDRLDSDSRKASLVSFRVGFKSHIVTTP